MVVSATASSNRNPGNRLLAALPRREYQRIAAALETVSLTLKQVIYDRRAPVRSVYFPINAVVSLVARMSNGDMIEIATIGKEGVVGLPVFFGSTHAQFAAFAQIEGQALRMKASDFRREVRVSAVFSNLLFRYTDAFLLQVAQAGACNQLHSVQQRCARWLLMCNERVGSDEFVLTQEFLCQMLSVRRTSVSEVASTLQQAGLIRYSRGKMTILDRPGLESVSCECYQVIRKEYERAFSSPSRRSARG